MAATGGGEAGLISVVIPALNEAPRLPRLLRALRAEPAGCETIVVDGGSEDGTAEAARRAGATLVLSAPRGRGQQMRAGAEAARGAALLFLHADTAFPPGGLLALGALLRERPEVVGGNFRLAFDGRTASRAGWKASTRSSAASASGTATAASSSAARPTTRSGACGRSR